MAVLPEGCGWTGGLWEGANGDGRVYTGLRVVSGPNVQTGDAVTLAVLPGTLIRATAT